MRPIVIFRIPFDVRKKLFLFFSFHKVVFLLARLKIRIFERAHQCFIFENTPAMHSDFFIVEKNENMKHA